MDLQIFAEYFTEIKDSVLDYPGVFNNSKVVSTGPSLIKSGLRKPKNKWLLLNIILPLLQEVLLQVLGFIQ